jgi:hypothetical protein
MIDCSECGDSIGDTKNPIFAADDLVVCRRCFESLTGHPPNPQEAEFDPDEGGA